MSAETASPATYSAACAIGVPLMKILLSAPVADTEAPPPYKFAVENLSKSLETKQAEDPRALHQEFSKAFDDDEVARGFRDHMLGLANAVSALRKQFRHVHLQVKLFDLRGYNNKSQESIPALEPDWAALHERYNTVILDSRRFASEIRDRLFTFYNIILPKLQESNASLLDKLKNLEHFLGIGDDDESKEISEKLTRDENEAERITREFEEIRRNIGSFQITLKQRLEEAKEGALEDIKNLQNEIKKLDGDLSKLGTVKILGLFGGIVGVVGGSVPAAALEKAIKSKQDKLKEAVRREKQVPDQVQNIATEVATSTADMFIHLGSLVSIHSHIRTDAQSARLQLEAAISSDAPVLFREGSIELTISLYQKLELAVAIYEDGFDDMYEDNLEDMYEDDFSLMYNFEDNFDLRL